MTTITITFERMPDLPPNTRVEMVFRRGGTMVALDYFFTHPDGLVVRTSYAICHPRDTFSWETAMRLCVKRIRVNNIYRAFRRWMWLAKAAHECSTVPPEIGCSQYCSMYDKCGETFPVDKIAREFGRVTVEVKE